MKIKLCLWIVLVKLSTAYRLPDFIRPCNSDQSILEVHKCIVREARRIQQTFTRGLPEYGVDSMDPLVLDNVTAEGIFTTVRQKVTFVQGLSKMYIKNIKLYTEGYLSAISLHGDLLVTSDFDEKVVVLIPLISGLGKFTVNLNDVDMVMKLKIERIRDQEQREYLHIYDADTILDNGDYDIRVTDLTGPMAEAESLIQMKVNLFKSYIFSVFAEPSIKAATRAVVENLNNFFSRIPIEDFFTSMRNPHLDER